MIVKYLNDDHHGTRCVGHPHEQEGRVHQANHLGHFGLLLGHGGLQSGGRRRRGRKVIQFRSSLKEKII